MTEVARGLIVAWQVLLPLVAFEVAPLHSLQHFSLRPISFKLRQIPPSSDCQGSGLTHHCGLDRESCHFLAGGFQKDFWHRTCHILHTLRGIIGRSTYPEQSERAKERPFPKSRSRQCSTKRFAGLPPIENKTEYARSKVIRNKDNNSSSAIQTDECRRTAYHIGQTLRSTSSRAASDLCLANTRRNSRKKDSGQTGYVAGVLLTSNSIKHYSGLSHLNIS